MSLDADFGFVRALLPARDLARLATTWIMAILERYLGSDLGITANRTMLDLEEFHGTRRIDYGFAIAHFTEAVSRSSPPRVFSRFELMENEILGNFRAHVEYHFLGPGRTVHKCDLYGSEKIMSSQPQSVSETLSAMRIFEVEGTIGVDQTNGDIYQRFVPERPVEKDDRERSFDQWLAAARTEIPAELLKINCCQVDGLIYVDAHAEGLHQVGLVAVTEKKTLEQALGKLSRQLEHATDFTEANQWLQLALQFA